MDAVERVGASDHRASPLGLTAIVRSRGPQPGRPPVSAAGDGVIDQRTVKDSESGQRVAREVIALRLPASNRRSARDSMLDPAARVRLR